ncbi:uncharacterized protein L969DRAFT_15525 [Mixia osmundae IAM 14324]|uniref:Cytochrome c oxidase assembly protein CtaG/Cox11 n=1 Tax=Mixia osmundae (strain CBS 9802 / IAM 14324 / JCM 22182 / KY 12970) TaxID=764103 RepID=G7DYE3_MIXOS|nr:uncharacterized protein L969DRAFT_15525 [Mixia osmundae IAM 14324]KEI41505.1 hypothetical protein L969DRAFT_15525 [Mixia osmundae IAM 14324]GAA95603.1 hypothetical protein E5Q_02259 [Mixia osmundae IAM 14324]
MLRCPCGTPLLPARQALLPSSRSIVRSSRSTGSGSKRWASQIADGRTSDSGASGSTTRNTAWLQAIQSERTKQQRAYYGQRNRNLFLYTSATVILGIGVTYAAVPLYRAFCSATGFAGTPLTSKEYTSADRLVPAEGSSRRLRVRFNADCSDALPWSFSPQQREVRVLPGETALAFYTATNHSDKDIIGIATYNVTPDRIAPYFAKVECFCFDEQRILAGEEVDLPVFFFIDRDYLEDPLMRDVDDIVLSYTFFKARRDERGQLVPDNGNGGAST